MASKCMILLLMMGPYLVAAQSYYRGTYAVNLASRFGGAVASPSTARAQGQVLPQGQGPPDNQRPLEEVQPPGNSQERQPQNPNSQIPPQRQPANVLGANEVPLPTVSNSPTRPPAKQSFKDRFSSKLFQPIASRSQRQNLVFSPVSVHALLGMIYGASEGRTAQELQQAGEFGPDPQAVGQDFRQLIKQRRQLQSAELTMASRMFYNKNMGGINHDYPEYAEYYYSSGIEPVDMGRSRETAGWINAWVSDKTRNKIRELVTPSDIDGQTEAMLVNAIYFKARWATEFSATDTISGKFRRGSGAPSNVAMMFNDDVFGYADLPDLGATALEMPYADSEVSMLILLPYQVDGLAQLEQQLARPQNDLNRIAARLRQETVTVRIPKFRIQFEQDMTEPLQQLGVREMFTRSSQVTKMLDRPVRVSKILQKAFLNVNEAGSEAAAASYAKFVPLSLPVKSREFNADHPFVFALRTPDSVLFIGHVLQPTAMA
ncbi:alaserpin [Drosophila miranda]|uniref:alaserpin n=1 Tax=Drosophila miranda TaxID=7229 RepID=UPI0007E7401D|nr:alaserpin [Drosophila miranda]